MEGWKGPRDFRRESVNESRKRSMERRNEYEINSIPPSAAWRATPCIYMRSPGKLSPFCLSPFLSPPLHASPPAILSIFLAPSPRRFFSLSLPSLPPCIFERLFTRLVAQFHGVVSRAPATTMDKRAEKGRLRRGPSLPRVKILFFLITVSSWKLPLSLSLSPHPLDIIASSYLIRYAF